MPNDSNPGSPRPGGGKGVSGAASAKERKRQHRWEQKNRWMPHYELKYGVQPVEFSSSASVSVVRAKCRFCESFGREVTASAPAGDAATDSALEMGAAKPDDAQPPSAKRRKKRQTLKLFGPNFRTDNLESHLSREHPARWQAYDVLHDADKKLFFPSEPQHSAAHSAASAANEAAFAGGIALQSHGVMMPLASTTSNTSVSALSSPLGGAPSAPAAETTVASGRKTLLSSFATAWSPLAATVPGVSASSSALSLSTSVALPTAAALTGLNAAIPSPVLEMLNQLLGLRAPGATWQPFVFERFEQQSTTSTVGDGGDVAEASVETGEARNEEQETTQALARSKDMEEDEAPLLTTENGLMLLASESLLLFCADAFRAGLSVDATLVVLQAAQRLQPLVDPAAVLNQGAPVTRTHVVRAVRQLVARNLSALASLTACTWGFSLTLRFCTADSANSSGGGTDVGGFVDVRLQLPVHDELEEVHVLALPLPSSRLHSIEAAVVGAALAAALAAVDSHAMEKLVGVTVDGDPYHVGALGFDVARWLQTQAQAAVLTSGEGNGSAAAFYVRPSGAFLLNLAVEDALTSCQREFSFLSSLAGVEALCKTHRELRELLVGDGFPLVLAAAPSRQRNGTSAGASWSPLSSMRTHWLEVYTRCEWLAMHRETLIKWQRDHPNETEARLLLAPPPAGNVFWVLVFLLRDVLKDLQVTLERCVRQAASFADVQRHLREFVLQQRVKFNIKADGASEMTQLEPLAVAANGEGGDSAAMSFAYQDFVNAVIPLDLFMYEAFQLKTVDGVGEHERTAIFRHFHALVVALLGDLQVAAAVSTVASPSSSSVAETETSATTTAAASMTFADLQLNRAVVPPCTPFELAMLPNLAFMELLNGQQARLRAKWSGKVLAQITEDRNRLVAEFTHRGALYEAVTAKQQQQQAGSELANPRDAWRGVSLEFPSLSSFAAVFGGLLAVSKPATAPPAPDCSNMTLEAQLQALQLPKLSGLRKQLDSTVV
ncbi:hypothetical protein BBJ28_00000667 [Nothophytophthora sp. Chile5]|nr:hypothetical protein BBJ28_00000667 [Nothophytophthora sp. Chile5]